MKVPFDRPLAIGLFGHAYKGKGFDRLLDLRNALPAEVAINVAGRGTEKLPPVEGVNVLGGVDGEAEDRFFGSIRAILLPYANSSRYGEILSVSGVAARSFAYGTPVIAAESGTLSEAAEHGGLSTAPNRVSSLAELAFDTVSDEAALAPLALQALGLRAERTIAKAVQPYISHWGRVVSTTKT
jgi:glycosyltransferase involved in cell wall biosynthesis